MTSLFTTVTRDVLELVMVSERVRPVRPSVSTADVKLWRLELIPARACFLPSSVLSLDCNCLTGKAAIWEARVMIDSKSWEKLLTPVNRSGVMEDIALLLSVRSRQIMGEMYSLSPLEHCYEEGLALGHHAH